VTNIQLSTPNVGTAIVEWSLGFVGPNITGAKAGISTQPVNITDILTNRSNVMDSVVYRISARNNISTVKTCFSEPLDLVVRVNPTPELKTLPPLVACSDTVNNGLIYTANLRDLESAISSPSNTTINWYSNASLNPADTLADPAAHPMQHNIAVYAEVISTSPSACKEVVYMPSIILSV
jgi:hypothetical protein